MIVNSLSEGCRSFLQVSELTVQTEDSDSWELENKFLWCSVARPSTCRLLRNLNWPPVLFFCAIICLRSNLPLLLWHHQSQHLSWLQPQSPSGAHLHSLPPGDEAALQICESRYGGLQAVFCLVGHHPWGLRGWCGRGIQSSSRNVQALVIRPRSWASWARADPGPRVRTRCCADAAAGRQAQ